MKNKKTLDIKKIALVLLLLIVVAFIAFRISERSRRPPLLRERPLPVETIKVNPSSFSVTKTFTGTVDAVQRTFLSSSIQAELREIFFREGERLKRGDLLLRLDASEPLEEKRRIEASMEHIRVDLAHWRKVLTRDKTLFKAGAISEQALDNSQRTVEGLEMSLREKEALQRLAMQKLSDSEIRAPFAATVQDIRLEPGELALPGQKMIELIALSGLKVIFSISEKDYPSLEPGQAAEVEIAAEGRRFGGKIDRLYPAFDGQNRFATAEIDLKEHSNALRPGMSARVHVIFHQNDNALIIPAGAVHNKAGGNSADSTNSNYGVYLADGGRARWQEVRVGRRHNRFVEVLEGLERGETVVVTPDPRLREGMALMTFEKAPDNR